MPASTSPRTVADASEAEVLAVILSELAGSSRAEVGPGDDAAVIGLADRRVVATTDTLVHGPDFRLAWSGAEQLGAKAAAVNLADVAAMGATPRALLVALAMPGETTLDFVRGVARGFRDACARLAPTCAVEGGDLTVSDTLVVAVTALGSLDGVEPVRRSGARRDDVLAVAGDLGAAGRGLRLLFERFCVDGVPVPVDVSRLRADERSDLRAQLAPEPPIALGAVAAAAGATAMMDVSDGLVLDASRMADASGVTLELDGALDDDALTGGEDHALLATFPPDRALPEGFRPIGRVRGRGPLAVTVAGGPPPARGGWDPYRDHDARRG